MTESDVAKKLLGAWCYIGTRINGGNWDRGANPKGMIYYGPHREMAVQIAPDVKRMRAGAALFLSLLRRAVAGRLAARAHDDVGQPSGAGLEGEHAAALISFVVKPNVVGDVDAEASVGAVAQFRLFGETAVGRPQERTRNRLDREIHHCHLPTSRARVPSTTIGAVMRDRLQQAFVGAQ